MTLLLATTNPNKVREIRPVFAGTRIELLTLADLPAVPEPAETGATFWENARLKAIEYSRATGRVAVAEDSGLVIDSLDGEPGVRSARLAARSAADRAARFVTALAVADGSTLLFETQTRIEGVVAPAPAGTHGFGYDPIFFYPPFAKTTAEMTPAEKTGVSHRARAFRDLRRALRS
jgi:XTP/dITP diphosphohydrolase